MSALSKTFFIIGSFNQCSALRISHVADTRSSSNHEGSQPGDSQSLEPESDGDLIGREWEIERNRKIRRKAIEKEDEENTLRSTMAKWQNARRRKVHRQAMKKADESIRIAQNSNNGRAPTSDNPPMLMESDSSQYSDCDFDYAYINCLENDPDFDESYINSVRMQEKRRAHELYKTRRTINTADDATMQVLRELGLTVADLYKDAAVRQEPVLTPDHNEHDVDCDDHPDHDDHLDKDNQDDRQHADADGLGKYRASVRKLHIDTDAMNGFFRVPSNELDPGYVEDRKKYEQSLKQ